MAVRSRWSGMRFETVSKSDVLDCQWLQQLMTYGLLNGALAQPRRCVRCVHCGVNAGCS